MVVGLLLWVWIILAPIAAILWLEKQLGGNTSGGVRMLRFAGIKAQSYD
jgi:hypothetical protein